MSIPILSIALEYLFPSSVADGTLPTVPMDSTPPYSPPFNGGQCFGLYRVSLRVISRWKPQFFLPPYAPPANPIAGDDIAVLNMQGKILGTYNTVNPDGSYSYGVRNTGGNIEFGGGSGSNYSHELSIVGIVGINGNLDNCGNLPNPNLPQIQPIPNGGIPTNNTPVVTNNDRLIEAGLPVLFIPTLLPILANLAAQLGAAIAAVKAALDCVTAVKALADAVARLADQLDSYKDLFEKLRKYLNKKEKEEDAKKQYFIRQYGSILRDGYLDVTPRPAPDGFKPLMLDFQCFNIPNGLGRFFGNESYNWFRYQELGSICFLSPTRGVLSVHKIEHIRTSIAIPELAIGFTYNLGLNGIIRARVSMLYTQEKT